MITVLLSLITQSILLVPMLRRRNTYRTSVVEKKCTLLQMLSIYFFRKSKQKALWPSNRFAFKGVRHDNILFIDRRVV